MSKKSKLDYDKSNALETYVAEWIIERAADYQDGIAGVYKDLSYGGCQSGYVSDLIYSTDCREFIKTHLIEIQGVLDTIAENLGECELGQIIFKNFSWDKVAWLAFEETANLICGRNGY